MKRSFKRYWYCQLIGWSFFLMLNIGLAMLFGRFTENVLLRTLFFLEVGLFFSHLMREFIRRRAVTSYSVLRSVISLLTLTFVFAICCAIVQASFEIACNLVTINASQRTPFSIIFFKYLPLGSLLLFIWNCIYFMVHFEQNRRLRLESLRLETLATEKELKTIRKNVNKESTVSSLNRIREMIGIDPSKARNAITELSNKLREDLNSVQ